MIRLRLLTLISVILAGFVFFLKSAPSYTVSTGEPVVNKAWLKVNHHPATPQRDVRPADQTFLTYPEWFLVFRPKEQADYFKLHTSTSFPYTKHVAQLWGGYSVMYDQIKGNFKFNTGYHVMIMVIGVSTTVEYGVKSWYETIIGRLTDNSDLTEEDKFNARYMRSYVDFIEDTPWYEYDFAKELRRVWTTVPFFGAHFLRKIERRYYLTNELLVKSCYGWLIKQGTKSAYDDALLNTAVIAEKLPLNSLSSTKMKNIALPHGGAVLMSLPRYADFNPAICKLASRGVIFKEIAGNNGAIVITIISSKNLGANNSYKQLFVQPIVTKPGLSRIALVTTVANLSDVLRRLLADSVVIEHIYDY